MKKQTKNHKYGIYFLSLVSFLYLGLVFLDFQIFLGSLKESWKLTLRIAPIMVIVLFFMVLLNHFVHPEMMKRYLGKGSGIKGYLLAIATGIFSHGPIFVWYPLLKDFKKEGMNSGLIAVFLYNRAVKIPILPLMIAYFGIQYVSLLIFYTIVASVFEGVIIDKIEKT